MKTISSLMIFHWKFRLVLAVAGMTAGFLSPAVAVSQETSDKGSPKIVFPEPTFDFGEVDAGKAVTHEFTVYNKGDSLLKVSDVSPACGCTVAKDWNRELSPGESGKIAVKLDTGSFSGPIQKRITVKSNDPQRPSVALKIKGSIWRPVNLSPSSVYFRVEDRQQSPGSRTVRIENNMDEPLQLSAPKVEGELCRAKLETIKAGQLYKLHIEPLTPFDCYAKENRVRIKTSSDRVPEIRVKAVVIVKNALVLLPRQIDWPAKSAAKHTSVVTIINKGDGKRKLSNPTTNIPGVNLRMKQVEPGKLYRLFVEFPADFEVPESGRGEVSVETDTSDCPLIEIPVLHEAD